MWFLILTATPGMADGFESVRQADCGRLNEDTISLISVEKINAGPSDDYDCREPTGGPCSAGDWVVWYMATYKKPLTEGNDEFRSSRIHTILDVRRGVYFETDGLDCTEPNGEGSCHHFEFEPGRAFRPHMNDRGSWDRIAQTNIGGVISRCLKKQGK